MSIKCCAYPWWLQVPSNLHFPLGTKSFPSSSCPWQVQSLRSRLPLEHRLQLPRSAAIYSEECKEFTRQSDTSTHIVCFLLHICKCVSVQTKITAPNITGAWIFYVFWWILKKNSGKKITHVKFEICGKSGIYCIIRGWIFYVFGELIPAGRLEGVSVFIVSHNFYNTSISVIKTSKTFTVVYSMGKALKTAMPIEYWCPCSAHLGQELKNKWAIL